MTVTQYIGSRYVPIFANPIDWDNKREYEPLTIVSNKGNSYTSRQAVPKGIDIENEKYWALTGNYNSQVESYRQETKNYVAQVGEYKQQVTDAVAKVDADLAQQKKDVTAQLENQDAKITNQLATQDSKITSQLSEQDAKVTKQLATQDSKITSQLSEQDSKVASQIATIKSQTDMISNLHYFPYYNMLSDPFPLSIGSLNANEGIDKNIFSNYDYINPDYLPPYVRKQGEQTSLLTVNFDLKYIPVISQVTFTDSEGTFKIVIDPKTEVETYFYSQIAKSEIITKNGYINAILNYSKTEDNWTLKFNYYQPVTGNFINSRISCYNHLTENVKDIQVFGYLLCVEGIFSNSSLRGDYNML